ncbi:MAG: ABC transporter permease [Actinobacteria bacterium]|nr:ABC transporter permease [Actinomycetota bacterium]
MTIIVFLIVHKIPGDPISVQLARQPDPVIRERLEAFYGLNRPLPAQYASWLGDVVTGDFGVSIASGRDVSDAVFERLPRTLFLMAGGLFVSLVVAVPAGMLAGGRAGSWRDRGLSTGALALMSIPEFWLGNLLVLAFSVKLGWFPTGGYVEPGDDPLGFVRLLVLPSLAVGASLCGLTMRTFRASMAETMRQEYIVLAASQGASRSRIVARHAARNALTPSITLVGLQVGYLLGGAIISEKVFSYPGLGLLVIDAVNARDYPMIQGALLLFALTFVLVNLAVDILVMYLEPRQRRPIALAGGARP